VSSGSELLFEKRIRRDLRCEDGERESVGRAGLSVDSARLELPAEDGAVEERKGESTRPTKRLAFSLEASFPTSMAIRGNFEDVQVAAALRTRKHPAASYSSGMIRAFGDIDATT
jgi:hypothetical protein